MATTHTPRPTTHRGLRIGIFGGTFNPIHTGHLVLAETAREALALDRVLFVPTHQPPHKRLPGLLPGVVRLKLVQLAIQGHPAFAASDLELRRGGVSYSIDTARTLRRRFPLAKLFLLVGEDMLAVRWRDWDALKRLCTVVVARRPGSRPARQKDRLRFLDMPQLAIASSELRERLTTGRSIRYLVPSAVERYLRRRRLYGRSRKP